MGVSIRNVDNLSFPGSVSYLPEVCEIIKQINANTSSPIILGGSAFSLFPEPILRLTGCKLGIVGEGENAFILLLRKIINFETDFNFVPNLAWISDDKFCLNKLCHDADFDFVLERGLINNRIYNKLSGMGNLQAKRGCKFKCAYCTYPFLEGRAYRLRSAELIAQEMQFVKNKYNTGHVFFVDSVFNYPTDHAAAICKAIIKKKARVTWSCFAWPHRLNKELLGLMKKAGCTHIEFGSDSLSEGTLDSLRKPFSVRDIISASKLCKESGIKFCHYVIFGALGENNRSLKESFDNIRKLKSTAIIAMVGARIYPGTELKRLSVKQGLISEDEDLLQPRFYISPSLDVKDLLAKVSKFASDNPNCIVPGMGIMSSEKICQTLRKHYKDSPLWGYLGG